MVLWVYPPIVTVSNSIVEKTNVFRSDQIFTFSQMTVKASWYWGLYEFFLFLKHIQLSNFPTMSPIHSACSHIFLHTLIYVVKPYVCYVQHTQSIQKYQQTHTHSWRISLETDCTRKSLHKLLKRYPEPSKERMITSFCHPCLSLLSFVFSICLSFSPYSTCIIVFYSQLPFGSGNDFFFPYGKSEYFITSPVVLLARRPIITADLHHTQKHTHMKNIHACSHANALSYTNASEKDRHMCTHSLVSAVNHTFVHTFSATVLCLYTVYNGIYCAVMVFMSLQVVTVYIKKKQNESHHYLNHFISKTSNMACFYFILKVGVRVFLGRDTVTVALSLYSNKHHSDQT